MGNDVNSLDASVIICTRNRAQSLARTLASATLLIIPHAATWEVIVVNNGSSDDTDDICKSFQTRLPIRVVHERCPGLSNARNRGIGEARGRYIIWTDDDVTVQRNWMTAYLGAFSRFPDGAFFGGKITPLLEEPAVKWFRETAQDVLSFVVAARDFGSEPIAFANGQLPFGANYAIRTVDQRAFAYDPELGVAPGRARVGEETAVMQALLNSGAKGYWVPDAEVLHHIGLSRQTEQYVRQYFSAQGETDALRDATRARAPILSVPRWIWIKVIKSYVAYVLYRQFTPSSKWVRRLTYCGYFLGYLRYYQNAVRSSRRSGMIDSGRMT